MNLYHLTRTLTGYDETDAFVIAAPSPVAARKMAAANAGCEGSAAWYNPGRARSVCRIIGTTNLPAGYGATEPPARIICQSYNAG